MRNEDKRKIIQNIDHLIGENDIKGINEVLKEINENINLYQEEFVRFLLGYTGVFKRDCDQWISLYKKIES